MQGIDFLRNKVRNVSTLFHGIGIDLVEFPPGNGVVAVPDKSQFVFTPADSGLSLAWPVEEKGPAGRTIRVEQDWLKAYSIYFTTKIGRPSRQVMKSRQKVVSGDRDPANQTRFTDSKIVEALGIGEKTLPRLRKRVCEVGPLEALEKLPPQKPPRSLKIDGEAEVKLIQLACSTPPEGYKR